MALHSSAALVEAGSHNERLWNGRLWREADIRRSGQVRKKRQSATSITDGGSVSGDRKLKESIPRLAPGRPQPPTMGFDNRAADREAHAHAVGLDDLLPRWRFF
jgi:hypothetical protein